MREANLELTGHVGHSNFKGRSPTEDIIKYGRACLDVKNNTSFVIKVLPSGVKVMNEYNEYDGAIYRAEGHDSVGILRTVRTSKSQLDLRRLGHANLVVTRDGIEKPTPLGSPKEVSNSFVAARDRHRNNFGNRF